MKIRPTLDVPDGDECGGCHYLWISSDRHKMCDLFEEDCFGKKLPQCRAAEVTGWQPIASAPMDGTEVIVAHGKFMAIAFADQDNDLAWTIDDGHDYRICLRRELANPTHWKPLPPAPEGE